MDIYEYLKKDHEKISHLFELFSKATSPEYKVEIIAMIMDELSVHAIAEQETFYKYLEAFNETQKRVHHSEEEHAEIMQQIKIVAELCNSNDPTFEQSVMKLKELVEHHVKEEEGPLFREAKKIFSEEEAIKIKLQMHDYKEKLLHRLETV